jgi:hypothetical protein
MARMSQCPISLRSETPGICPLTRLPIYASQFFIAISVLLWILSFYNIVFEHLVAFNVYTILFTSIMQYLLNINTCFDHKWPSSGVRLCYSITLHNRTPEDGHLWSKHVVLIYNKCCIIELKTKLRGFSPQAKYTDRASIACRRS